LLRRLADQSEALPFHVAYKKTAYIDAEGRRIEPAQPNAVKFEQFIFDLMPRSRHSVVVEVDRAKAFAPLKNAPGAKADTPEMAQAQMAALHRSWLRQAGAEVGDDMMVEISPLFALDAEELTEKIPPGTQVAQPTYFGEA
jgi:UDP-N-acetylglucosamine/UDP-N-acetylgalactosamine diphosphorylase